MPRKTYFPGDERVNTGVILAKRQVEAIEQIAGSEHTSRSDILRRAVDAYLRTAYPREQLEAIRERAGADAADEGEA